MDRYLWNEKRGEYDPYDLDKKEHSEVTTASIFTPLFTRAASPAQAELVRKKLAQLEKKGGLMASELTNSFYQWDGYNGWPPQQMMAVQGLLNYGYGEDAKRLCTKWVDAIASTRKKTGVMYERLDVNTAFYPGADDKKYPTQIGFRWMNSSYVWCLSHVLGFEIR
jgi:alpha,alpha-trehalase